MKPMLMLAIATAAIASSVVPALAETMNEARAAHRLPALHVSGLLAAIADDHARDMARRDKLDHAGFFEHRGPFGSMAENVAYGCKNATDCIRVWLRSPGHRRNIMLKQARTYGVSSARAASGRLYWAMELGP